MMVVVVAAGAGGEIINQVLVGLSQGTIIEMELLINQRHAFTPVSCITGEFTFPGRNNCINHLCSMLCWLDTGSHLLARCLSRILSAPGISWLGSPRGRRRCTRVMPGRGACSCSLARACC